MAFLRVNGIRERIAETIEGVMLLKVESITQIKKAPPTYSVKAETEIVMADGSSCYSTERCEDIIKKLQRSGVSVI